MSNSDPSSGPLGPSSPPTRPLFIYGTLRALPLLAWVLTGDSSNASAISKLVKPARIYGYARFSLRGRDYPALVKHDTQSSTDGYILTLETATQRKKVDIFEGRAYRLETVTATILLETNKNHQEHSCVNGGRVVDADVYLWAGEKDALTANPWELEYFEKNVLEGWINLFAGMELVSEDDESPAAS
ncbi:hypothetical protein NPX13_g3010 [Xylaria arbuscula]|uniref:Putative gamma-glutamylcyclotransferase n=1 Tax=Xylaria arbuscula TaxID=114810 RepID=A0A9W8NIK4_9PEZI|nr:hypothetical protein NPX13_g3010 [Xylaria arbuscula]